MAFQTLRYLSLHSAVFLLRLLTHCVCFLFNWRSVPCDKNCKCRTRLVGARAERTRYGVGWENKIPSARPRGSLRRVLLAAAYILFSLGRKSKIGSARRHNNFTRPRSAAHAGKFVLLVFFVCVLSPYGELNSCTEYMRAYIRSCRRVKKKAHCRLHFRTRRRRQEKRHVAHQESPSGLLLAFSTWFSQNAY